MRDRYPEGPACQKIPARLNSHVTFRRRKQDHGFVDLKAIPRDHGQLGWKDRGIGVALAERRSVRNAASRDFNRFLCIEAHAGMRIIIKSVIPFVTQARSGR